ncbi:MAG: hypothetical protein J5659_05045 [Clostridia bacterium]|nr:hypothetical protein [Clostridia bacterium]
MFTAVIFLILISGSVFSTSFFNKRFEEMLPITCMSITTILFLFSLLGKLAIGFYIILISVVLLLIISILNVFVYRKFIDFLKNLFTPAFFIFAILMLLVSFFNKGKLASSWDEFSHWVDSIKAMYLINDFVTNKNSFSIFKSYPPIMTLFQYFFTKLNSFIHNDSNFLEEKVYVAYQIFSLSFFFPLIKDFSSKKICKYFISVFVLFCTPLFFFKQFLCEVYIDPFVAILSGCALSSVFINYRSGKIYHIYIALTCFTLVLAKDVGLYFAIFVFVCYAIRYLSNISFSNMTKIGYLKSGLTCIIPLITTISAKLFWKWEIITSKAEVVFGGKIDLVEYTKIFFTRNNDSYKKTVVENFKNAFFENHFSFGDLSISISYFNLTVMIAVAFVLIYFHIKRVVVSKRQQRVFKLICFVIMMQVILYIYSLGATYVSNFSEYEAVRLASYTRYMNTVFLSVFIVITAVLLNYFYKFEFKKSDFVIFIAFLIITTPFSQVERFFNKNNVRDSIAFRSSYTDIVDKINLNCKKNSKIFFISQADQGINYHVVRYSVRPLIINNAGYWSIGNEPYYDGDIWTSIITADELKNKLVKENYDYVAVFVTNESFNSIYASLFEDTQEIENNSLFMFDRKTLKLRRVDR